jgi:redox-sensitive bicupin YhaK (pirin superfamily)
MTNRTILRTHTGQPASDGGGVRLTRVISPNQGLDPFLLLDEFDSAEASDYLAGFPAHPHRGFETVTYMLDGHMRHEDSFGNRGDLGPGDVQWMTAAHGIIHSEMPQQTAGRMRGFQLWLNLPAREKMKPAAYRDIPSREIPTVALGAGGAGADPNYDSDPNSYEAQHPRPSGSQVSYDIFKGVNQYAVTCKVACLFEEADALVKAKNIGTGV